MSNHSVSEHAIIETALTVTRHCWKYYRIKGLFYEALQVAVVSVCSRLHKYDPNKSKLVTYVFRHVRDDVFTFLAKEAEARALIPLDPSILEDPAFAKTVPARQIHQTYENQRGEALCQEDLIILEKLNQGQGFKDIFAGKHRSTTKRRADTWTANLLERLPT